MTQEVKEWENLLCLLQRTPRKCKQPLPTYWHKNTFHIACQQIVISDLDLDAQDLDYLADHEDFGVDETEPDELEMGRVGAGGLDIGEA